MDYSLLEGRVDAWFKDRGIYDKATVMGQNLKGIEECLELHEALTADSCGNLTYENGKGVICDTAHEIKDGIGDRFVTLIGLAKMCGIDPLQALSDALDVIEDRKGEIVNGQFVKEI